MPPRADYQKLSKALSSQVVRWEHASFALNQLEPFNCERSGWKPGRKLKKPPRKDERGYSYGFSSDGKLLIERSGQFESLNFHEKNQIRQLTFDRSAILWAKRQRWDAKSQREAAAVTSWARLVFRGGRLWRVDKTWPGKKTQVERYQYDVIPTATRPSSFVARRDRTA